MKTRIFIVDDHPLVREWLGNLLRLQADLEISGEAEDSASALAAMTQNPPDVAIVDLSLKRGSGQELIKAMRTALPRVLIVVLSMHEELADAERALRAGARGYVMKRESTSQIVEAIRRVRAGHIYANADLMARLTERILDAPLGQPVTPDDLSDRELDVFRRLGDGQTTRRIAEEFGVSLKTVQTYCGRIKEKLGLMSGSELVRAAVRWQENKR